MRLDISLGRGKLKLLFSPEISLVLGLGAHQLRIPLDIESEGLADRTSAVRRHIRGFASTFCLVRGLEWSVIGEIV